MACCGVWVRVAVLGVLGLLLIIGSVVFQLRFHAIFDSVLADKLVLRPGSKTLESFKDPPVPIFMQFWLFNVTNAEAVLEGAVPKLDQVGPYTYQERQLKFDLEFHDDAGTVTYKQNKTFFFRPDLSEGHSEDDLVTTVNAVMMTLGSKITSLPSAVRALVMLQFMRFNMAPFVTHPVRQLLFEGYEEPLLRRLAPLTKNPVHATGRFGFFFPKNNTNDGTYTVNSGTKGMAEYQHIVAWQGRPRVDFWKGDLWGGDTCNMINGTSGNQFPRPASRAAPLTLYTAELCRSIYAEFQREVTHGPVTLYRYVLPRRLLADTPENRCYCTQDFTCRASMIDVGPCRGGAPVVMSTPHFYQGAAEDVAMVEGLNPRAEEHETYLDVEPNTGVTMRAAKRIQVNIAVRRYADLPSFRNMPEVIFPVLWVNESAEVPMERTRALHSTLTKPFTLVRAGTWALVALGVVLLVVAVALTLRTCWPARDKTAPHNRRGPLDAKDKENGLTDKLSQL